jgi:hypothetical protein
MFVKSRLSRFSFLTKFSNIINNRIVSALRTIISKSGEWIFIPAVNRSALALESISKRLIRAELKTSDEVSNMFTEIFTYIGLLLRKTIDAEVQIIWPVLFAFIVLVYFILTMQ